MNRHDRLEQILDSRVLRVGTSMDTPGFSMRKPGGGLEGFDIDALATLSQALDIRIEYVPMEFGTMLAELAADQFDIAMSGMGRTVQRASVATYSRPYLRNGRSLLVRSSDADRLRSIGDMDRDGVRIGHRAGAINENFAVRMFRNATLTPYATNEAGTADLLSGRIDAQVCDYACASYLSKQNAALRVSGPLAMYEPIYSAILMNKHDHTLLNLINIWIDHMEIDGTLDALTKKWLGDSYAGAVVTPVTPA